MEKKKIWITYHQVNWDETSLGNKLNLTGLNIMLQRAAVEHAEHLGFGFHQTSKQNMTWVLIGLNIEINRLPKWGDKIRIETWPKKMEKLTATREFLLCSEENDEVLCRASSDWLIIDMATRRPQRMDIMGRFDSVLSRKDALKRTIPKPDKKQSFKTLFSITPRFSSLDLNGHTNARKYFDWLDDAIYELHELKEISFVQMSYYHECKYGEEVLIQFGETDKCVIRGWKPEQNQQAFLAKVEFR